MEYYSAVKGNGIGSFVVMCRTFSFNRLYAVLSRSVTSDSLQPHGL